MFTCFYVCVHACYTYRVQKRTVDPLGPELEVFLSHLVGAGTQNQVLWKSIQCSQTLAISPAPDSHIFIIVFALLFSRVEYFKKGKMKKECLRDYIHMKN